jgi:hypothetical protein
MKAMAIIRESIYESIEEQRLSIATFARSEGIDVSCWQSSKGRRSTVWSFIFYA